MAELGFEVTGSTESETCQTLKTAGNQLLEKLAAWLAKHYGTNALGYAGPVVGKFTNVLRGALERRSGTVTDKSCINTRMRYIRRSTIFYLRKNSNIWNPNSRSRCAIQQTYCAPKLAIPIPI